MPEFDASKKFPINAFTPLSAESAPTYADTCQLQDEMNSCTHAIKNSACPHGYSYLSHTDAAWHLENPTSIPSTPAKSRQTHTA
jgi:hypothetical protein